MPRINLLQIIEDFELDRQYLAKALFPENKYSNMALTRILSGEAQLEETQILKLASMLNISLDCLFNNQWSKLAITNKSLLVYERYSFRAELDLENFITKVFYRDSLIYDEVLHSKSIKLTEYFEFLESIILNYNNDESKN